MNICEKEDLNYIVIDFETANWNRNSACSVGLVRFINGIEKDSITALIHPVNSFFIQEWTDTIHGISFEDVKNEPRFPEIWKNKVLPFINKTPDFPLVAHNSTFDMSVIRGCCDYYQLSYPNIKYFDSLLISRKTWPELENHKLTFLGHTFGIKYRAHDALEDSRTCGKIVALAAEKWGTCNLEQLLENCGIKLKNLS